MVEPTLYRVYAHVVVEAYFDVHTLSMEEALSAPAKGDFVGMRFSDKVLDVTKVLGLIPTGAVEGESFDEAQDALGKRIIEARQQAADEKIYEELFRSGD